MQGPKVMHKGNSEGRQGSVRVSLSVSRNAHRPSTAESSLRRSLGDCGKRSTRVAHPVGFDFLPNGSHWIATARAAGIVASCDPERRGPRNDESITCDMGPECGAPKTTNRNRSGPMASHMPTPGAAAGRFGTDPSRANANQSSDGALCYQQLPLVELPE